MEWIGVDWSGMRWNGMEWNEGGGMGAEMSESIVKYVSQFSLDQPRIVEDSSHKVRLAFIS